MTFREIIRILEESGFAEVRCNGSHHIYSGVVDDRRQVVTVAYHRLGDDIHPKTRASIIRQSGLAKRLFD